MKKQDVVEALHVGIAKTVTDFHAWSGGESIKDWGVESLLTVTCAQALAARIEEVGAGAPITLEQDFASLVHFSGRQHPKGRPIAAAARLRDKPSGRVDIVLWNKRDTPRAIIEIKRRDAKDGLVRDANRVIDFIKAAGKAYSGSVRYGAVATVLQGPVGKSFEHMEAKAERRREALAIIAKREGMVLKCSGPRLIKDAAPEPDCASASLVFIFTPPRGD